MEKSEDYPDELLQSLRDGERVFVFTGAGVSKESGLPTFRDADGLWKKYDPMTLATMEAFVQDPVTVWNMYRMRQRQIAEAQPNPAHVTLADMENHYTEFLLATQNVDDLHERAGSRKMVKIHGDVWQMRCLDCGRVFDLHDVEMPNEFALDTLPKCVGCQGFCRPNIVWFGEYVPQDAMTTAVNSAANCDLMIIVGTSGEVSGGYGFAEYALQNGATVVEINPARGALTRYADFWVPEAAGIALPRIWKMVQG